MSRIANALGLGSKDKDTTSDTTASTDSTNPQRSTGDYSGTSGLSSKTRTPGTVGSNTAPSVDKYQEGMGQTSTTSETTTQRNLNQPMPVSDSSYDSTGRAESDRTDRTTMNQGQDDAMTRSEERLHVGKESNEAGMAKLHKYVTSEKVEKEVPLKKESVRLEREPITEANRGAAMSGPEIREAEYEMRLKEERPLVQKETVPIERVRLAKEVEHSSERVGGDVRKEHIEYGTTGGVQTHKAGFDSTNTAAPPASSASSTSGATRPPTNSARGA